MKKSLLKILLSFTLAIILSFGFAASAESPSVQDIPFDSFSYWSDSETAVAVRPMYDIERVLSADTFNLEGKITTKDIFTDTDNLYILESEKGRVIICDKKTYAFKNVLSDLSFDGEKLRFKKAEGIYVKDGSIYICDTDNERIIVTDINGNVSRIITCPESDIIPEDFLFSPTEIKIDGKGFIYVISKGSFYGALRFNNNYEFMGFYGANPTTGSLSDIISNIKSLIMSNNEKMSGQAKTVPYQFVDISIDSDDFIYTVTDSGTAGQIRKLSPGGSSILKVLEQGKRNISDSVSFGVKGSVRRTFIDEKTSLTSIAVNSERFIFVADKKFGRILIYDLDGRMICAFGGGLENGTNDGNFKTLTSIHIDGEKLYAVDEGKSTVTVFALTQYGRLFYEAADLTARGEYKDALGKWQKVLDMDRNCQAAYCAMAKSYLVEGNYDKSLQMAKLGKDPDLYGQAYSKARDVFIQKYFYLLLAGVLVVLALIVAFVIIKHKKKITVIKNEKIKMAISMCVHPFEASKGIKEKGSVLIASVILFLLFVSKVLCDFFSGYMYGGVDVASYNTFYTLLSTAGIVCLWTVANWGICSVQGGKGKMSEVFIASSYSMVPLIVYQLFTLIISNIFTAEEAFFMGIVNIVVWCFTLFTLLISHMQIHEYDFFKFLKTTVLAVLGMGLIIFLIFMIIILIGQVWTFIQTLYSEMLLR